MTHGVQKRTKMIGNIISHYVMGHMAIAIYSKKKKKKGHPKCFGFIYTDGVKPHICQKRRPTLPSSLLDQLESCACIPMQLFWVFMSFLFSIGPSFLLNHTFSSLSPFTYDLPTSWLGPVQLKLFRIGANLAKVNLSFCFFFSFCHILLFSSWFLSLCSISLWYLWYKNNNSEKMIQQSFT